MVKAVLFRSQDTLRRYIEDRHEVSTMEQPPEIMRLMKRMELPDGKLYDAGKVLETADLAKFAKYEPRLMRMTSRISPTFVNQTKIELKPDPNELEAKDGEQGEVVEQSGKTESNEVHSYIHNISGCCYC